MAGESGLPDDQVEFVLRIWLEEGNGASFWRGSVEEIESSLVSHFQDGRALLRFRTPAWSPAMASRWLAAQRDPTPEKDDWAREKVKRLGNNHSATDPLVFPGESRSRYRRRTKSWSLVVSPACMSAACDCPRLRRAGPARLVRILFASRHP